MFFKLVLRNGKRSHKENGLFFASLLISIVAFYMILSLSNQDVMLFLKEMESDAVDKLLHIIPALYGMTLILLFFLIYYASKFQLERRRHEFGVYLMMGMQRIKLFGMLLAEDMGSSLLALLIGLPVAVLLAELVSLVTAKLVGLGIIGHHFTISLSAILWTAVGFMVIKLVAFLILSGKIASQEIGQLLTESPEAGKKAKPKVIYILALILGIGFLAAAYSMAICGIAWQGLETMALTLFIGLAGTFLLFYGLRMVLGVLSEWHGRRHSLRTFTFRQIQEIVIRRSGMLAVSSLLILAALCCFGAGAGIAVYNSDSGEHILDYTFEDTTTEEVRSVLAEHEMDDTFSQIFDMQIGMIRTTDDYEHAFNMKSVIDELTALPQTDETATLLNNFSYATYPYLISVTSYNKVLSLAGKQPLELNDDEAIVYMDNEWTSNTKNQILNQIFEDNPVVSINDAAFHLTGTVQSESIVTDRSITLAFALIVPDEVYAYYTKGEGSIYVNAVLSDEMKAHNSLMQVISATNDKLDTTGLTYESFLKNMGRQLFYVVAASYITIYLAIIFMIIANTVIGVQFLTSQQKTIRRYRTLTRLGASYSVLCQSANQQIRWYFGIPTVIAVIGSPFGVRSLLRGITSSGSEHADFIMMLISVGMIAVLCVIEYLYIRAVRKASNQNILKLMVPEREE